MGIKLRLTIMNFLQLFIWGAWLITISVYWFNTNQWSGETFGAVFATLGFSSIIMPPLTGIIADRWINAEKLYGILQILYGISIYFVSRCSDAHSFYSWMFLAMLFYMPTISLNNAISYYILKNYTKYDVVKVFPNIRVWGTIGFILAMWVTNLSGNKGTPNQFIIASVAAIVLGLYSFTLPKCPPQNLTQKNASVIDMLGLNAFKLFLQKKWLCSFSFLCFSEQRYSLRICMAILFFRTLVKIRATPIHL